MDALLAWDTALLYALVECATPLLDRVMLFITHFGDGGIFWGMTSLVLFCIRKTRPIGLTMVMSMAMAFCIGNLALKNLVARPRPYMVDPSLVMLLPPSIEAFSFPSGHATNAFASAVALGRWRPKQLLWALPLAILVAFSRVYLKMHFPTDVLAGALLGGLCALLAYHLVQHWELLQRIPFVAPNQAGTWKVPPAEKNLGN